MNVDQQVSNSTLTGVRNRQVILSVIRDTGPISRTTLTKQLGLTSAAVTTIVRELIHDGIVVECGSEESAAIGRKPIQLIVNPAVPLIAGARVRKGYCQVVVANLSGDLLASRTSSFAGKNPEDVYKVIQEQLGELTAGRPQGSIEYLCVATPGLCNVSCGVIEYSATMDWRNVPFKSDLSARLGIPVNIEHYTNAASYAYLRAMHEQPNIIFVNWGIGISIGIVVEGHIYRGSQGFAGELGHISVDLLTGAECSCGGSGCLESICGLEAVLERLNQHTQPEYPLVEQIEALSADDLQKLVPIVQVMGSTLANLVNLFNPDQIILGGEGVTLARRLWHPLLTAFDRQVLDNLRQSTQLRLDERDMVLQGAVALAGTAWIDAKMNRKR